MRRARQAVVYHALVWIQGKTEQLQRCHMAAVYHALVWIQGKTTT